MREKNIIEFYLWENPRGLLMLDELGNAEFLAVMTEEMLNTHYDMAQACEAPEKLLNLLKSGKQVPYFPTADGYYTNECQTDWQDYLHEVNFTCGINENNLCSLVSPATLDSFDDSRIRPFQSYLQSFDEKYSQSQ